MKSLQNNPSMDDNQFSFGRLMEINIVKELKQEEDQPTDHSKPETIYQEQNSKGKVPEKGDWQSKTGNIGSEKSKAKTDDRINKSDNEISSKENKDTNAGTVGTPLQEDQNSNLRDNNRHLKSLAPVSDSPCSTLKQLLSRPSIHTAKPHAVDTMLQVKENGRKSQSTAYSSSHCKEEYKTRAKPVLPKVKEIKVINGSINHINEGIFKSSIINHSNSMKGYEHKRHLNSFKPVLPKIYNLRKGGKLCEVINDQSLPTVTNCNSFISDNILSSDGLVSGNNDIKLNHSRRYKIKMTSPEGASNNNDRYTVADDAKMDNRPEKIQKNETTDPIVPREDCKNITETEEENQKPEVVKPEVVKPEILTEIQNERLSSAKEETKQDKTLKEEKTFNGSFHSDEEVDTVSVKDGNVDDTSDYGSELVLLQKEYEKFEEIFDRLSRIEQQKNIEREELLQRKRKATEILCKIQKKIGLIENTDITNGDITMEIVGNCSNIMTECSTDSVYLSEALDLSSKTKDKHLNESTISSTVLDKELKGKMTPVKKVDASSPSSSISLLASSTTSNPGVPTSLPYSSSTSMSCAVPLSHHDSNIKSLENLCHSDFSAMAVKKRKAVVDFKPEKPHSGTVDSQPYVFMPMPYSRVFGSPRPPSLYRLPEPMNKPFKSSPMQRPLALHNKPRMDHSSMYSRQYYPHTGIVTPPPPLVPQPQFMHLPFSQNTFDYGLSPPMIPHQPNRRPVSVINRNNNNSNMFTQYPQAFPPTASQPAGMNLQKLPPETPPPKSVYNKPKDAALYRPEVSETESTASSFASSEYGIEVKCSMCDSKAVFICAGCRKAPYCSNKCQGRHWSSHRHDCVVAV